MEKRCSFYNRSSSNIGSFNSPIAESTKYQACKSSDMSDDFPWGGKVSPKTQKYLVMSPKGHLSSVNKSIIDPRMYTDIHSKGLTSRIVKYHDDSLKHNRSLSASNLYNKPGQFPIVHLKKSQIQFKANRNKPLSVARIPPPDRAVFQANTRSSILRTSSIVPSVSLRKTNSELSCENRPILHPADSDLIPTKSVLDALKEISRKTINSDDLGGNHLMKKYSKEAEDIPNSIGSSPVNSLKIKRTRETQISPNSKPNSFENAFKKPMYSRNNDITSSLSSSLFLKTSTTKRKLNEIQGRQCSPTPSENSSLPKAKQFCNEQNEIYEKSNSNTLPNNKMKSKPTEDETFQVKTTVKNNSKIDIQNNKQDESSALSKIFNSRFDKDTLKDRLEKKTESTPHDDSLGEVKFIKPRKAHVNVETNPLVESMNQERLREMLFVLSNEDSLKKKDVATKLDSQKPVSTNSGDDGKTCIISGLTQCATTLTTSASVTFATNTTASTSIISSATETAKPATDENQSTTTETKQGFNFGTEKTTPQTTSNDVNIPSATVSSIGGFKFGVTPENSPAVTSSTTVTSSNSTSNTAGGFTINVPKTTGTEVSTTGNRTFSFLAKPTSEKTEVPNPASQLNQGFSFNTQAPGLSATSQSAFVAAPKSEEQMKQKIQLPFGDLKSSTEQQGTQATTSLGFSGSTSNSTLKPSNDVVKNPVFNIFPSNPQPSSIAVASTTSSTSNQASSFIFGTTTSSPKNSTAVNFASPQNTSIFGNFSSKSQADVNAASTVTATPSTFTSNTPSFGLNSNASQTLNSSNTSLFSNVVKPSSPNLTKASTSASTSSNLFGNKSPGGFSFTPPTKNFPASNISKENPSTATPFAFTSNTSGAFSFKSPTNTTTPAPTNSNSFSFTISKGSGNQGTSATPFTLGSSSSTEGMGGNQAQPASSNVLFNFGVPNKSAGDTNVFQAAPSSSTFSFQNPNTANNKQSNFSFANPSTAVTTTSSQLSGFSFTKSTSQNAFSSVADKSSIGGFAFGQPTSSENKSIFGSFSGTSASASGQQPAAGKFFPTGLSSNKNETKPKDSSIFSGPFNNNNSSKNTSLFGGSAFNFNSGTGSPQSIFGGQTSSSDKSVFGSVGPSTVKPSTQPFSFGSNSTAQQQQQQDTSSSAFVFGSSSATPQKLETSKPFAFGTPSNTNQTNLFSSGAVNTLGNSSAFNFSAQPNASGEPPDVSFNSATGNNLPSVSIRPIIKATRRLKNP